MLTKVYNEPRIFQIDVPLPDNPLRNLNCYVVQDGGETLIIDTGFNRPECREALLEGLAELRLSNPARGLEPTRYFEAEHVADGDEITVGRWKFTCVSVPGHTPGQMCLYCAEKKLMFTADHILFDITPNITQWKDMRDALGNYLDSLVKIRGYAMETALPAHRKNEMDVYVRINQIVEHHLTRLCETVNALEAQPNSHATAIAAHLKWSMRGKTWEEFPLSQRWFAVGETIAHLEYLMERGLAKREEGGAQRAYRLTVSAAECKEELNKIWENYR